MYTQFYNLETDPVIIYYIRIRETTVWKPGNIPFLRLHSSFWLRVWNSLKLPKMTMIQPLTSLMKFGMVHFGKIVPTLLMTACSCQRSLTEWGKTGNKFAKLDRKWNDHAHFEESIATFAPSLSCCSACHWTKLMQFSK